MTPYAPQGRHSVQQPAPQYPAPSPAHRLPQLPTQRIPARQAPVHQNPLRQTPVQQLPVRQLPVQQLPFRQVPVRQFQPPFAAAPRAVSRAPHPALIVAFGILVAALVITTVMLVRNSSQPPPVRSAGTVPTPPVVLTTSAQSKAPTTDVPTTKVPTTKVPTTQAPPTTSEPTTSKPTTSKPPVTGRAAVVREATVAAQAWARAVSSGDAEGVLARSCRQDVEVYSNGELTNPGELGGRYQFTFQKVTQASSAVAAAIVRFGISPKLGSLTKLDSYVTQQSGRWLVCLSVTELADL